MGVPSLLSATQHTETAWQSSHPRSPGLGEPQLGTQAGTVPARLERNCQLRAWDKLCGNLPELLNVHKEQMGALLLRGLLPETLPQAAAGNQPNSLWRRTGWADLASIPVWAFGCDSVAEGGTQSGWGERLSLLLSCGHGYSCPSLDLFPICEMGWWCLPGRRVRDAVYVCRAWKSSTKGVMGTGNIVSVSPSLLPGLCCFSLHTLPQDFVQKPLLLS